MSTRKKQMNIFQSIVEIKMDSGAKDKTHTERSY